MARKKATEKKSAANIGFEAKLWLAADKLRNNMDAAEYKHVVLGFHKHDDVCWQFGVPPKGNGFVVANPGD